MPSAPPTAAQGRGQALPRGLPRPASQPQQPGFEAASVELYLVGDFSRPPQFLGEPGVGLEGFAFT